MHEEELARTENGYTAGAEPGQIQTTSMDIVQVGLRFDNGNLTL